MNRYKTIKPLGDGTYGSVVKAVNRTTGEIVAIKRMKKKFYSWEECMQLREVQSLRKMSHPNIVKLVGAVLSSDPLWIVTELCQCSLLEWLRMAEVGNEAYVGCLVDVANGCNYLSSHLFVHRVRAYVHTTDHGEGVFKMAPTIVI